MQIMRKTSAAVFDTNKPKKKKQKFTYFLQESTQKAISDFLNLREIPY